MRVFFCISSQKKFFSLRVMSPLAVRVIFTKLFLFCFGVAERRCTKSTQEVRITPPVSHAKKKFFFCIFSQTLFSFLLLNRKDVILFVQFVFFIFSFFLVELMFMHCEASPYTSTLSADSSHPTDGVD